jgi:hypothetical protein
MSAADGDSLLARKFNITTSINSDPVQWNKEWDKALHSLSAKDVYAMLSPIWTSNEVNGEIAEHAEVLKGQILKLQNLVVKLWDQMESKDHFVTAWLLLEERDRQAHLLKGLEEACKESSFAEVARAMCPDIKISSMLKRKGKSFTDLISSFTKGKRQVGEDNLYEVPSEWWEKAVDISEPLSQEVDSPFALLTIQRNEFISESIIGHVRLVSDFYPVSSAFPHTHCNVHSERLGAGQHQHGSSPRHLEIRSRQRRREDATWNA